MPMQTTLTHGCQTFGACTGKLTKRISPYWAFVLELNCLPPRSAVKALDAPLGPEIGVVEARWTPEGQQDEVVGGLSQPFLAGAFHDDAISQLPPDAVRLAAGKTYPVQAFRRGAAVGLQFHPEATPEIFREWSEVALRRFPWLEELIRAKVYEFERLDAISMQEKQALVNNFIDSVRHTQARKNSGAQTSQ